MAGKSKSVRAPLPVPPVAYSYLRFSSHGQAEGDTIRRRRECKACQVRYTTYERPQFSRLVVRAPSGMSPPESPSG